MLEKMKNLESETFDIINMLIILDKFVKNTPEFLVIEPFCDVLLEKSQNSTQTLITLIPLLLIIL